MGVHGRVGEHVSQRIVTAKLLKTITIISQIHAIKLFFFEKDFKGRLVHLFVLIMICKLRGASVNIKAERRRHGTKVGSARPSSKAARAKDIAQYAMCTAWLYHPRREHAVVLHYPRTVHVALVRVHTSSCPSPLG